jgi:hypothetical protein
MELSPSRQANSCPATKKLLAFYETESLLPCSQESAAGLYPEPDESSPHPPIPFLYDPF